MAVKVITDSIKSISVWMGISIHVWIVAEEDGVTLVDTGLSFMTSSILKEIDRMNAGPLKRILLTHGHSDHVGGLKKLLRTHDVPVYMHAKEIPYAEGDLAYPGKERAYAHVEKGLLQPLPVTAGKNGELAAIGALIPYFTPGHSPGHTVYYHDKERVLLAGDMLNAKSGRIIPARFTPDPEMAMRSGSDILRRLDPERMEVCHGGTVFRPAGQLDDLEEGLKQAREAEARLQARKDSKKRRH
ncbi:MBL fold metallo-hydrolase [Saccharibacillus kuerlensis]|uniref:Metallo-hydrolase YybB n=1 Tax=Saccharibacillus kuerlensis TaxID=459527 RepID=A0ABQ2KR39_9BACL|nr:MBL fold metallo-hydrolase [Saccharibacillus kuerlensis]GGN90860.1 putative metallo-hydrolase YybB [Saccharibacillus kuerlensis]